MIIFRPHRGSLDDAMKEAQEFNTIKEMKGFIVNDWHDILGYNLFEVDDVVIIEDSARDDNRIGWKSSKYVGVKGMGDKDYIKLYNCPQCVGMCSMDYQ